MTQTYATRTAQMLITNAFKQIGELGDSETAEAADLANGLEILNEVIDTLALDSIYIPYLTTIEFNFVLGQGTYTISSLISADIVSNQLMDIYQCYFTVGDGTNSVLYQVQTVTEQQLNANITTVSYSSLPAVVNLKQFPQYSAITFYPQPPDSYPCTIRGPVMLNNVSAFDNLAALPPYYYSFLKYAVARKLVSWYPSANWTETSEDSYQVLLKSIQAINPVDMTLQPSAVLATQDKYYVPNLVSI